MKKTIALQRAIQENQKIQDLDRPEIQEKDDCHRESQYFTASVGGLSYRANSKEKLLEILSSIRNHRIQTQNGTLEIHEQNGVFTTLGPDGVAFQAGSLKQLQEIASQFYALVMNPGSDPKPIECGGFAIRENKIEGITRQVFTAMIDGIAYQAGTRAQLLEMIAQVHPIIDDPEARDQRFHNLVFHPEKYPIT